VSDPFDDEDGGALAAEKAVASIPLPRENAVLVGQDQAEAALLKAYHSGRLPHAWLLTGRRGIGKASLAFRFARFLLAQSAGGGLFAALPTLAVDEKAPVFRRVASGGHADLLLIEKAYDQKRKRYRSEIVVEDVRAIGDFLHLTPAEAGWRIVIVDGADEMNRNAANALLKVLEEPSRRSLLLITSASPGVLPPTLRSRCRHLALRVLSDAQITDLLRQFHPSLESHELGPLVRLAEGSIGRALDLAATGGLTVYRDLVGLLATLPAVDAATLDGFADRLGRAGAEDNFRLLAELLPAWVARMVTTDAGGTRTGALTEEELTMARLAARPAPGSSRGVDRWIEVWEKLNRLFTLVDIVNLDRKQVVLNAFFTLAEASR